MERYVEKKRERRIRDFRRMIAKARLITSRHGFPPDDVIAHKRANNLKSCSCSLGCGNGRRHWGDRTVQECRQSLAAIEQLIEVGRIDDGPGQRDVMRRSWV